MSYNAQSLCQLSKKLAPADIPLIISLACRDSDLSPRGAPFALASQLRGVASVTAVRDGCRLEDSVQRKFLYLDGEDTFELISQFEWGAQGKFATKRSTSAGSSPAWLTRTSAYPDGIETQGRRRAHSALLVDDRQPPATIHYPLI